ncbi:MAG: Na+/H+ antiporter NhaD and related arsenite permeases, partial [uncultured Solirubrobacteraceae bacterium]
APGHHHLRGRARRHRVRARRPNEGRARRRGARRALADDRPGARDRGDRLGDDRAAGRDDAHRPGDRADRDLHVPRDPRRAACAWAAAGGGHVAGAVDGAAVGVPGQPHDRPADGADHLPARRRARHRPDPARADRDHRLEHRRYGDADRRSAEHPHRRRDRPVVRRLRAQPRADRRAGVRRRHRDALPRLSPPAADRARGARARDGARGAPLDRGHGRAQAHAAGARHHAAGVLRPQSAGRRARDRRPDGRHGHAAADASERRGGAARDRVADPVLLRRAVRHGRRAGGDGRHPGGRRRDRERHRRQPHGGTAGHHVGLGDRLRDHRQHPVHRDDDPGRRAAAGGQRRRRRVLVGAVAGRVLRRQLHARRGRGERRCRRHGRARRTADRLHDVLEGRCSGDACLDAAGDRVRGSAISL